MRKFTLKLTMAVVAVVAGFASCQDYHEDLYADLKKSIAVCDTTYSHATISLQNQIDSVAQVLSQDSTNLAGRIAFLSESLQKSQKSLDSLIDTLAGEYRVDTAEIYSLIRNNQDSIDALKAQIVALLASQQQIQDNKDSIAALKAQIGTLLASQQQIQDNKDSIAALKNDIAEIQTLKQQITDLQNDLKDTANYLIATAIAEYLKIADTASLVQKSDMQAKFSALMDSLSAHRDSIEKFSGFMDSIKVHRDSLDNYKKYIDTLFAKVQRIHSEINTKILDFVDAQITSIQIQQINSGAFMNFATPYGVKSNILAVNWGEFKDDVTFPTISSAVRGPVFTSDEIATSITIPAGKVITSSDSTDNAGVVYLTLNPIENDFDGKEVSLINSNGDVAMTSTLEKTNDLLTFGYGWGTKAAIAGNGSQVLYKAPFQINEDNLDIFSTDLLEPYKSIVKNFINDRYFDPTQLFWASMEVLNEFGSAYAVKASYKDSLRNGKNVTDYQFINKSVITNFEIAAIAQKPLNINAFDAIKEKTSQHRDIPTIPYDKIKELYGKVANYNLNLQFDTVSVDLPSFNIQINESNLYGADFSTLVLEVDYEYPDKDGYYVDTDGTIKHNGNMSHDVAIVTTTSMTTLTDSINAAIKRGIKKNLDYVAELLNTNTNNVIVSIENSFNDEINNIINSINGKLEDIEKVLTKIQKYVKKGQRVINSTYANKIVDKANAFIKQFNNIKNDPAILVDPQLFYLNDKNELISISEAADAPTTFSGTGALDLIMSSLTSEFIVPAYKKYITVLGKKGQCGADFDQVLEGGQSVAVLENLSAGDYTIKYSFVDYAGNISTRVFYIRVI